MDWQEGREERGEVEEVEEVICTDNGESDQNRFDMLVAQLQEAVLSEHVQEMLSRFVHEHCDEFAAHSRGDECDHRCNALWMEYGAVLEQSLAEVLPAHAHCLSEMEELLAAHNSHAVPEELLDTLHAQLSFEAFKELMLLSSAYRELRVDGEAIQQHQRGTSTEHDDNAVCTTL